MARSLGLRAMPPVISRIEDQGCYVPLMMYTVEAYQHFSLPVNGTRR